MSRTDNRRPAAPTTRATRPARDQWDVIATDLRGVRLTKPERDELFQVWLPKVLNLSPFANAMPTKSDGATFAVRDLFVGTDEASLGTVRQVLILLAGQAESLIAQKARPTAAWAQYNAYKDFLRKVLARMNPPVPTAGPVSTNLAPAPAVEEEQAPAADAA